MTGAGATAVAVAPAVPAARPSAALPAEVCGEAARLERAAGLLLRRLRATRPGDLTRSQSSVLATVQLHGPLSLADLARHESVQAPTASRAVDLLVQRGLLRREVDPADHRRQLIDLAGDAAELLELRSREAVSALAAGLVALGDVERELIAGALPALERLAGVPGA